MSNFPDRGGYEDYFLRFSAESGVPDGSLDVGEEPDRFDHAPDDDSVSDADRVSGKIETFMNELHGTERYSDHNDRIWGYHKHYAGYHETDEDPNAPDVDRMAILLHDFVDHTILNPDRTADRKGESPERAEEIRGDALDTFNALLDEVGDQDALIKAYLFAIDTCKWEQAARMWRDGASDRIDELVEMDEIDEDVAVILNAAINKTPALDNMDKDILERVLRRPEHYLADLELGAISEGTLNHNIKGLYFKALETLDLILHPPKDNPASTYRDCTEAINFFVPALMGLGYKQLAIDLRDHALRWFFNDSEGYAGAQHELSEQYFDDIKTRTGELLDSQFGGIELTTEERIKSEGSLREKLTRQGYEGVSQAPDGIGLAFIVPDDIAGAEMSHFASEYRRILTEDARIEAGHPKAGESDFEDMQGDNRRSSGYEAVHMNFFYYPVNRPDVRVPFEIQVMTREQHRMKLYGPWNDLSYKASAKYNESDQPHLDHLARRAAADRELSPGTTIQSIAEMAATTPEIPSSFNKLFRAIDLNGARVLVPPELEQAIHKLPAEALGKESELTVLPANHVTEAQFLEAMSMFGSELATDKNILNALELVRQSEAGTLRNDGTTTVMEGHILPTTLSAVMLAIQSGKIWSNEFGPVEHVSNVTTISLLHDYVENELEKIDDEDVKTATYRTLLFEIKHKFDTTIMEGIEAMTVPFEIEDEFRRREQYTANILANEYASLVKPADRLQNHMTDIIRLVSGRVHPGSEEAGKIMEYFLKTDRHLSGAFTSQDLPDAYARVHNIIWQFARHYGYQPPDDQLSPVD